MKCLSKSLARALAARGIHYGWFMVVLTMGYLLCSSATLSIPGVLLTPMSRDLGWSIADLSGPLGLRVALFGLVRPVRWWTDAALRASCCDHRLRNASNCRAAASNDHDREMAAVAWTGHYPGIASGMTALILAVTVATRWFTARRGLVIAFSAPPLPPGSSYSSHRRPGWEHYGWRAALMPSIFMIGLLAAAFVLFSRDRPSMTLALRHLAMKECKQRRPRLRATFSR